MGWFKSQKTQDAEKINSLLNEFNITHQFISNDGKWSMVLDDENQILGCINVDYGSKELETMQYNEIDAVLFSINGEQITGVFDLEPFNKEELEKYTEIIKKEIVSTISSTELFNDISLTIETALRGKELFMPFFSTDMHRPPVSKTNPLVESSIEKYIQFTDLLRNAILIAKEDKK